MTPPDSKATVVTTIGYEGTTVAQFLDALREASVRLVVDIRAVASSRRPGFSKTRLAANLEEAGIGYVHLRGLGTPADGRAAARAGKHEEMRRVFAQHLTTEDALTDMERLVELVAGGQRLALLCFEADARHCHRRLVAQALSARMAIEVRDLVPGREEPS
jgi:uncharacterized protein (DUF488 family)